MIQNKQDNQAPHRTYIREIVADADLVTITMNGMTDDYQMFITGISVREKIPKFEELTRIIMQEEERRLNLKPQSADLALMAKKKFFIEKGNPSQQNKGNPQKRHNQAQGMYLNRNDTVIKCFYCRKIGHMAKECRKKKFHEE